MLTITARRAPADLQPLIEGKQYASGLLTSHGTFAQVEGYFEIRARFPQGQGLWPAFWLLPADGSWPPEIDVVEALGHEPATIYGTVHWLENGEYLERQGATTVDDPDAFHTYGVLWEQDRLVWYVDLQPYFETPPLPGLARPLYLLLGMAVGGRWPGSPDASTPFPAEMQVDYVRAYLPR